MLVDDHRLFREGIHALIDAQDDVEVIGEAADSRTALQLLETVSCDLIMLDITLPGPNGIAMLHELKRRKMSSPTLMLTMHENADMIADSFAAGATGYAVKNQPFDELVGAMHSVARRENYLAPHLPQLLTPGGGIIPPGGVLAILSAREREIFDLDCARLLQRRRRQAPLHQHQDRRDAPHPHHEEARRAQHRRAHSAGCASRASGGVAITERSSAPRFHAPSSAAAA